MSNLTSEVKRNHSCRDAQELITDSVEEAYYLGGIFNQVTRSRNIAIIVKLRTAGCSYVAASRE